MNEKLNGRLLNYKFGSALDYCDKENEDTVKLVTYLADNFSNCGWILGDFSILIDAALESIGVKENDDTAE